MAQRVKRLPTIQETQIQSLGQEDPLEEEMATHSSTLGWKIPWTEEPGRIQSMGWRGVEESNMTDRLHFHFSLSCIGQGNGNKLLYSCLENPIEELDKLQSIGSQGVRHD